MFFNEIPSIFPRMLRTLNVISNLALDAPLVATFWWLSFTVAFGEQIDWHICLALFPSVWAIYLLDRIFDAGNLQAETPKRKTFANERRSWLKAMLILAVIWAGCFGLVVLRDIWLQVCVIASVTAGYFLICRWKARTVGLPMKEVLIGFCFAAGVGLPFELPFNWIKAGGLGVFGLLCWMNCLIISRAEAEYDRVDDPAAWFASGRRSFPFLMCFAINLVVTVMLLVSGIPVIIGAALVLAHFLLLPVLKGPRQLTQSLADAALWISGGLGVILAVIFGQA